LTGPSPSWVSDHDGILFVQIDLTLASISAIAAGNYDVYLRSYAASVRSYGKPVVIGVQACGRPFSGGRALAT
jgi:hypothetical protein